VPRGLICHKMRLTLGSHFQSYKNDHFLAPSQTTLHPSSKCSIETHHWCCVSRIWTVYLTFGVEATVTESPVWTPMIPYFIAHIITHCLWSERCSKLILLSNQKNTFFNQNDMKWTGLFKTQVPFYRNLLLSNDFRHQLHPCKEDAIIHEVAYVFF